ncbi:hypothetical protein ACQP1W_10535 [Spirillospora sp. CA-255316]
MKLRALLSMPDLRLRAVTGEDGLDREIRWVGTTDLLTPGRDLSRLEDRVDFFLALRLR